jgi:hypothetical protein
MINAEQLKAISWEDSKRRGSLRTIAKNFAE